MKIKDTQEVNNNENNPAQYFKQFGVQDQKIKKIFDIVFWGYFVLFALSMAITIAFDLVKYTGYFIAFFFSYIIIALLSFFG
jgi:hypothetical protein